MKNKRIAAFILAAVISAVLSGCGGARYQDGAYYAEMPEFATSGWKDTLELTLEGGRITRVNWDAIYVNDDIPIRKKQYSKSGLYGMLAAGAVGEWYDQAIAAEQYVLENGIDALAIDPEGHSDAVSGCTIHVSTFDQLIRECLVKAEK